MIIGFELFNIFLEILYNVGEIRMILRLPKERSSRLSGVAFLIIGRSHKIILFIDSFVKQRIS